MGKIGVIQGDGAEDGIGVIQGDGAEDGIGVIQGDGAEDGIIFFSCHHVWENDKRLNYVSAR